MINLNLSVFCLELSLVFLLYDFSGFLVALHKTAMDGFFIGIGGRLKLDNNNTIAFIFNGLNGQLGIPILDLYLVKGLEKRFPLDAVAKDEVDGVKYFLKEFAEFAGSKAAAAGASLLLIAE